MSITFTDFYQVTFEHGGSNAFILPCLMSYEEYLLFIPLTGIMLPGTHVFM